MDINRRGFLGVAASAPLTAKEIAKRAMEAAQEANFFTSTGVSAYGDSIYTGVHVPDAGLEMRSLWDAIRDLGMPEWKRDDLRDDARRSRTLDPDIATLRSLSLSSKIRKQWSRNYDVLVERAYESQEMERMKRAFFEKNPDIEEY